MHTKEGTSQGGVSTTQYPKAKRLNDELPPWDNGEKNDHRKGDATSPREASPSGGTALSNTEPTVAPMFSWSGATSRERGTHALDFREPKVH